MAKSFGRLLKWGAAAAVAALAVTLVLSPVVPMHVTGPVALARGAVLLPIAAGLVLIAVLTDHRKSRELDQRVRAALEGHSMPYELAWLLLLLVLFLIATPGVSYFAGIFFPGVSWEVMMPPIRILLLFVLPLIVVDLGGFTISGYSTVMPMIAMGVKERWRWMGAVPSAVFLVLMALVIYPAPVPALPVVLAAAVAIVAAVAVPEEIFFRALMQTRLERLLGRWLGILLGTALFTVTSVYLSEFGDFSRQAQRLEFGVWHAIMFYAGIGLLNGYLWSAYRNIWLNIFVRSGTVLLRVLPALQFM
ncbi:type II CAAX prenyl endopeptidase Rce1 family protein [Streptomonospora algeriensis]|uniref:Type II CAAX prenyl endopeptidase Rce1 family protein n=1 Tax=Streptomonospora algeriensis TaxID=995084 RepID=A0ABW3BI83_9ACTN